MSLIFNDGVNSSLNQTPSTGADAMFRLKRLLKQAGWTIPKSSDGTTYNSSGDQISSGGSGTNGMDNSKAWFVVQVASGTRSFCIQRNTTTGADTSKSWRIKYSKGAGFSGGSPSATVTPSATDEQILLGAGTDASPTFAILFFNGDGLYRFHCVADNASPYGWLAWTWTSSTGTTGMAFGLDPLTATAAEDTDPYAIYLYPAPAVDTPWKRGALTYAAGQLWFWLGSTWYKSSATLPTTMAGPPAGYINTSYPTWGTCGDNVHNNKDDIVPLSALAMLSTTAPWFFWKGVLTLVRACLQSDYRVTGCLYSVSSSKDSILVGNCVLPWDGSSTPLV